MTEFEKELVNTLAQEAVKSVAVSRIIAGLIADNKELVDAAVKKIDSEQLGKALAYAILRRSEMGGQNTSQVNIKKIITDAQNVAAQELADRMQQELMQA